MSRCCFSPISTTTTKTNLTTNLYHTSIGIIAFTWSQTFLGTSLHIHHPLHLNHRITFSPLTFWKNHGSLKHASLTLLYNLSNAKFGSGPEPTSSFSLTLLQNSQPLLQIGDLIPTSLILRKEHVHVHNLRRHTTTATFGGRKRTISIYIHESELVIEIDENRVIQVRNLEWKFRGSNRVEVDGHQILVSWDVYNWLFDECDKGEGYALFTLRFESQSVVVAERVGLLEDLPAEVGWRKKRGLMVKTKSLEEEELSASASSASSACGSVMEWESVEETEMKGPTGFSLLVYAWKK